MALWGLWALVLIAPVFATLIWFVISPRPTPISLTSRHVLITGGSSGIGLCVAQLAAFEGAKISIVGRDTEKLKSARTAILDYYKSKPSKGGFKEEELPQVHFFSADVKSFESIEKAVNAAVAESGPLDVLVCCHGVAVPQTFEDTNLDTMYHMLDTNLKGNLHTIKAALPHINKDRPSTNPGCIAIFSTQAAQVSLYGYAAYSASKGGLRSLAEALQQELLPYNIRVSVVYPPDTDTPGFIEENKTKPELTAKLSETSKGMDPLDVAKAAIKGIKVGHFNISCGFEGFMLNTATAGMSPQTSLPLALTEIFSMGLLRIVALIIISGWNKTIRDWHRNQKK
ncbi:unnamed protein product [Calypogeia fissa]